MIKFFKKHKNISLVVGALAIALVSGAGGAFVYNNNVCKQEKRRAFVKRGKEFSKVFGTLVQCYNLLENKHDHKDGSCCDACAKNLPCESKSKKVKQRQGSGISSGTSAFKDQMGLSYGEPQLKKHYPTIGNY